jgi:quercetin dioxygenase-like cupin family protein
MSETKTYPANTASRSRRELLRNLAVGTATVAAAASRGLDAVASAEPASSSQLGSAMRAYKLYTGPDNASHVLKGTINLKDRTDVVAIHFKETPAHSSLDWHQDPEPQFVITLSGTLEFLTRDGETFVLRPGEVLLAEDNAGSGHKWRLTDEQPWRRAYVVLKPGAQDLFIPAATSP